jgi:hypothetical protein
MTNGGKTMKKSQKINAKVGLGLLMVAALVLAAFSTQAWALVDCADSPSNVADSDGDGFKDAEECNGIPVYHSADLVFLNPNKQDLFVILVYATDLGLPKTNIPANPLEFVSNPIATGGLEFTTHLIPFDLSNPDRFVSSDPSITQKAVRITEDLDANGIVLGVANQGTPNGLIRHTIAHEIGHMTMLAVDYTRRFGGFHYKAGSEVILEQAVKYTSKKGKVTFYISTKYAAPSQLGVQLH